MTLYDKSLSADIFSHVVISLTDFIGKAIAFFQRYSIFGYKSSHISVVARDRNYILESTFPRAKETKIDRDYLDKHFVMKLYRIKDRNKIVKIPADLSHMHISWWLRRRLRKRFEKYMGYSSEGFREKMIWEHMLDFMAMLVKSKWTYDKLIIITLGFFQGSGIACAEAAHLGFDYCGLIRKKDRIVKPVEVGEYKFLEEVVS